MSIILINIQKNNHSQTIALYKFRGYVYFKMEKDPKGGQDNEC